MRKVFPMFTMRWRTAAFIISMVLFTATFAAAQAQEATPEATPEVQGLTSSHPGVNIVYPAPASEVWGTVPILGSADIADMSYYYLEYLPLNDDLSHPEGAPWLPATVAMSESVSVGALAALDTTEVTDGVYALRLVVTDTNGAVYTDEASPIRVSNDRYNNIIRRAIRDSLILAGITPDEPTPEPQPTTVPDSTAPVVVPLPGYSAVNVRRCDVIDNYSCSVVGYLNQGESAEVIGISSNGSGWYQVRLPSGLTGWVSPTVVSVQGDLSGVPSVTPPTPLTPPPAPTAANIVLNGISTAVTPTCGVSFNADVNVANTGNATSGEGTITLQDVNVSTGEVTFTGYGGYPAIEPNGNYVVRIPVTTTVYYNQQHELRAYTGSQAIATQYTLAQGSCGVAPTPQPPRVIQVNESNNGQTVNMILGDTLVITLSSQSGTGYSWTLSPDPLSAITLTSGPTNTVDVSAPGGTTQQQFTFTAVSPGQNIVRLTYQRPGEPPQQTFQITASVS